MRHSNLFASNAQHVAKRFLNIHEYQSMELMSRFGINVPKGIAAKNADDAASAVKALGKSDVVVKAQVLAGGRGMGKFANGFKGGVHKAQGADQVRELAQCMLGQSLVTKQTGPEGKPCNTLLIQERVNPKRELYFAILMDRASNGPVVVASTAGGMNIEDVAANTPHLIHKQPIDINVGFTPEMADSMADKLGFAGETKKQAVNQFLKLYDMFIKCDNTLLEINPLIETVEGQVLCADAKLNFDDNAEFRQKDTFALRDYSQEDEREVQAHKFDLSYIGLDGNIGCIVNGAGLAMATMDLIKLHGGNPANFLDVGGGATQNQVTEALKILNSDPRVLTIFVNIFGGIMRCDLIALGIINAAKTINLRVPLVVRMKGTNVTEGKKLLAVSGLRVFTADDLDEAATKAVRMAEIIKMADRLNLKVNFELPL